MTDVTQLLEKLGSDASLAKSTDTLLNSDALSINEKILLTKINELRDHQADIKCFAILPAEDEEPAKEQDDSEEKENTESAIAI